MFKINLTNIQDDLIDIQEVLIDAMNLMDVQDDQIVVKWLNWCLKDLTNIQKDDMIYKIRERINLTYNTFFQDCLYTLFFNHVN